MRSAAGREAESRPRTAKRGRGPRDQLKIWLARRFPRFRRAVNVVVTTEDGLRIPLLNRLGLALLSYEHHGLQAALRAVAQLRRDGVFVDVGANLGQSLLNVVATRPRTPYLGFEPDPGAVAYLRALIDRNGWTNCTVLCAALGPTWSRAALHAKREADDNATVSLDLRPASMYRRAQPVVVAPGDALLGPEPIFMIKLDVEGFEAEVLRGLAGTIDRDRPPDYFEVMGYGHLASGTYDRGYFGELAQPEVDRLVANRRANQETLTAFFDRRRYRLFRCFHDGAVEETGTVVTDPRRDAGEMNFLALP